MQAKGKVIFYADADNATDIHDFKPLYDEVSHPPYHPSPRLSISQGVPGSG